MKKIMLILLSALMVFSLFACSDFEEPSEKADKDPVSLAINTIIQDKNGEDQCFWEDGEVIWDNMNHRPLAIKSAILSLQTEYDMWFFAYNEEMELSNTEFYFPTEFEYDETKFEIMESNKNNHFILTVLQSCDEEKIVITLNPKRTILDENGEPTKTPSPTTITITISTGM